MRRAFLVVVVLLVAAPVVAQQPIANPTRLEFQHTDFAQTDSYVVGYFTSDTAAAPLQESPFAKPASCSPCAGSLPSRPTAFGIYWVAVRAVAGTVSSDWSVRIPFARVPVEPIGLVVR